MVAGRAHAVASAFAAFSGHNHYRRHHLRRPATAITARRLRRGDVLSVPELAAVAHLPVDEHVPGLLRAGAAAVAPPPQTPLPGPGVKPLGDSDATPGRPVGVTVADARHHLQIIGATGSGKSTLMTHLVCDDAAAGRGALVIDPKGDLIVDITTHLPARARRRVILIDPDHPLLAGHSGMVAGWWTGVAVSEPARPPSRRQRHGRGRWGGGRRGGERGHRVLPTVRRLVGLPHRRPAAGGVPDPARRPRNPVPGSDPRTAHQPARARPRHHPPPPRQRADRGRSTRSWPATGAGSPRCPTRRGRR